MLDKISDFFKDIKERLSNPFLSSFIIAWSIFNWRIVVGLVFYKQSELHVDGYHSYIDLIIRNTNLLFNLFFPVISALTYTLIFPFFRNWILIAGAWYKTWGNRKLLDVSKSGSISVLKYMALREKYLASIEQFVTLAKSESQYIDENFELKKNVTSLTAELKQLQSVIDNWENINSKRRLNGQWSIEFKKTSKSFEDRTEDFIVDALISNGKITLEVSPRQFTYSRVIDVNEIASNGKIIYLSVQSSHSQLPYAHWILKKKTEDNLFDREIYTGSDSFGNKITLEKK